MGRSTHAFHALQLRAVLAVLCAAALLVGTAPTWAATHGSLSGVAWTSAALDPSLPRVGAELQRIVVSGASGALGTVRRAVEQVGGTVQRELPIIDGVSATVPADRLVDLSSRAGVVAVTADRRAHLYAASWDESVTASSYAWTSGATETWATGARGAGVGIAVLDTGISPVNDLKGRVVHGPDLSGEAAGDRDSYGHGTVMAGVAAGSGVDGGATPRTGIAPEAHVVSVKVAGANGATDVSTVLAGMHWAAAFKDTYNIRVLNLSWGVPSTQDPLIDPLNFAVQRLWSLGITVVVAAGNSGPDAGTITKPGDDPVVLTVGAFDDRGDLNTNNDVVPKWSAQGPTAQGLAKPDLVAPGRTLVATRAPGSTVEAQNPKALVAPSYIKGSGTSEAAAVVSGAAALLLSARPSLTPDQVKAALMGTTSPIPNVLATAQGTGRLQTAKALTADVSAVPPQPLTATGTGTLEGSRGGMERVAVDCNGVQTLLVGDLTSWCAQWNGLSWRSEAWTGLSWRGESWSGSSWTGDAWSGLSWRGASWSGLSWRGSSWTSDDWNGLSWRGSTWTTAEYGDETLLNAFWGDRVKAGKRLPGELSEDQAATASPLGCARSHRCVP